MEGGGDPAEIRESIRQGHLGAVYFDDEFRRVFPEIGQNKVRAFHCQVFLASPPTASVAFVGPSATAINETDVDRLDCTHRGDGLFCSLSSFKAFYANDAREFFELEDVSLEDALEILRLRSAPDADLPVTKIRKSGKSSHSRSVEPVARAWGKPS